MKNQSELLFKPLPHQQFEIKVLQVRPMELGTLRALIDLQVGPFTIKGVRVVQQVGKKAWAALPQQQGQDGRWWPVVVCSDPELDRAIKDVALDAWQKGA